MKKIWNVLSVLSVLALALSACAAAPVAGIPILVATNSPISHAIRSEVDSSTQNNPTLSAPAPVQEPTSATCYEETNSIVMRHKHAIRLANGDYAICEVNGLYTDHVLPDSITLDKDLYQGKQPAIKAPCFGDPIPDGDQLAPAFTQDNRTATYNMCTLHDILGDKAKVTITDPHPEVSPIPGVSKSFRLQAFNGYQFYLDYVNVKSSELPASTTLIWDPTNKVYNPEGRSFPGLLPIVAPPTSLP